MERDLDTVLREKRIYNVQFDSLIPSSNDPDDDYYSEIIYYDGGGVRGYGDSEKS